MIALQEETTYVETQAKFVRELLLPEVIKPATYVAFVEVSRDETKLGSGSDTFEVVPALGEGYGKKLRYYFISLVLLVMFGSASIYSVKYLYKIKKGGEIKEKEPEEKSKKLEVELKALENAHKSGFISMQSYENEKKRISSKIGQLENVEAKKPSEKGFIK